MRLELIHAFSIALNQRRELGATVDPLFVADEK
jgi:hypothetical protein